MEHLIRIWMEACVDSHASVLTPSLSGFIMCSSYIGKCISGVSQNAGESGKKLELFGLFCKIDWCEGNLRMNGEKKQKNNWKSDQITPSHAAVCSSRLQPYEKVNHHTRRLAEANKVRDKITGDIRLEWSFQPSHPPGKNVLCDGLLNEILIRYFKKCLIIYNWVCACVCKQREREAQCRCGAGCLQKEPGLAVGNVIRASAEFSAVLHDCPW